MPRTILSAIVAKSEGLSTNPKLEVNVNIFATDRDPAKSAQALDDLRLNKMILESVQMLAVALAEHGCPMSELPLKKDGTPFKAKGWGSHPCTVWAKYSVENYRWLVAHTHELIMEKFRRTGKLHSMNRNMPRLHSGAQYMPLAGPLEFANSSLFKDNRDVIQAYKETMIVKWTNDKRPPRWTNSDAPDWAPQFKRLGRLPLQL